jgi:hypothetical protein
MSKPVANNKIIYQNVYGRVAVHDGFLSQGVKKGDSPTFANLQLTGDATIEGNLYVQGNTTILGTNVIEFEDNIVLINKYETGSGVTLNQAGLEIDRGSLENYRIIFNESDQTFRIGVISNTQAVATRENNPLVNGVMIWNNTAKRLDATNTFSIDLKQVTTTNSISTSSGSFYTAGGIGLKKDMSIGGQINLVGTTEATKSVIKTDQDTLKITSQNDIELTPTNNVKLPFNRKLIFGSTNQSVSANSLTNNIDIYGSGDVNFYLNNGKKITVPNQVPITFSTQSEKVYTDSSNNMVIAGSQDIQLNPGISKKVVIPVNIPLAFNTANQKIYSNLLNDLNIEASNNIYVTPGTNMNVCLPNNNGVKFGINGTQRIYANSSNEMYILASSDLFLSSSTNVVVPSEIPLKLGGNSLVTKTSGTLLVTANNGVTLSSTKNATSVNDGALVVNGGVGISKDVYIGGNLLVQGDTVTLNTETLLVEDNLIVVNNNPTPLVSDGGMLIKRLDNTYVGVFYRETTNELTIAYANTTSNTSLSIADYVPVRADSLHLTNTGAATSFSAGCLTLLGGAYIGKNLIVGTSITSNSLKVDNLANLGSIVTASITTGTCVVASTSNSVNSCTGSIVIAGGVGVGKDMYVGGDIYASSSCTGSIHITGTSTATSFSSGGTFTNNGGASIAKDVYIGNNLVIGGNATMGSIDVQGIRATNNYITGTTNSVSSSQGALVVDGGIGVGLDMVVGGSVKCVDLEIVNTFKFSGNALQATISNTSGNFSWHYFGSLNESNCDIDIYNNVYGTKFTASIYGTQASFSHNIYKISSIALDRTVLYVYKEPLDTYHLFAKVPPQTDSTVSVRMKSGNQFDLKFEGTSPLPNGVISSFDAGTWEIVYSTLSDSSLELLSGPLNVMDTLVVTDNLPTFGHNVESATDLGIVHERFQLANDDGTGDVVSDLPEFADTLPHQGSAGSRQIKLSNSASAVNNFYAGWWIKVTSGANEDQVRKITSYNGAQRVAQLETAWSSQNPVAGDTVELYNLSCVANYFDITNSRYTYSFVTVNPDRTLSNQGPCNLEVGTLNVDDITTIGTVTINETSNSSSFTNGGSFLTHGGASIAKNLYVGDNLYVGKDAESPEASLHISTIASTILLEQAANQHSYIDFTEKLSSVRYGILHQNDLLHLTWNTQGTAANSSNVGLCLTSQGNIGIGTTSNVYNLVTLESNNYISGNDELGYLGIQSHNGGSSIVLHGNTNQNNIDIAAGSSGSITLSDCLRVSNFVHVLCTGGSNNSTSGSFVVNGGVSVSSTENAQSITKGGALTIAGGTAITKDLYIGGNLYIEGNLAVTGSYSNSVTFSNTQNCSITSYGNNNIMVTSNQINFIFYVEVTPTIESTECSFEFSVPERTTGFSHRGELIASTTGYTDDTNIIPIYNIVCVGQKNTPRGMLKFHSVSTGIHYFMIMCRYTMM